MNREVHVQFCENVAVKFRCVTRLAVIVKTEPQRKTERNKMKIITVKIITKMKHKKVKLSILLLSLGLTAQAQQATTATGDDASGSGGTVAYSVGQIVYITNTGITGSVAQGVQQPYEISIVLGIDNHSINLELTAYPNPTTNYLTLNVGKAELSTLNFQLYDISGKLIESRKIISSSETITMENLPTATYFLKVTNNNKEVKTFKIIKN